MLESMGPLEESAVEWEAVVKAIPRDPHSWYQLGASRNRLSDWEAA